MKREAGGSFLDGSLRCVVGRQAGVEGGMKVDENPTWFELLLWDEGSIGCQNGDGRWRGFPHFYPLRLPGSTGMAFTETRIVSPPLLHMCSVDVISQKKNAFVQ